MQRLGVAALIVAALWASVGGVVAQDANPT